MLSIDLLFIIRLVLHFFFFQTNYRDAVFLLSSPFVAWLSLQRGCSLFVVFRPLLGVNYGDAVFLLSPVVCMAQIRAGMHSFCCPPSSVWRKLRVCTVFLLSPIVCLAQITGMQSFCWSQLSA